MENKNSMFKNLMLLVLAPLVVSCVPSALDNTGIAGSITATALFALALLASFYYIIKEYTKEYAWAYKSFVYLYAVGELVSLVNYGATTAEILPIAFLAVTFGLIIVLAIVKDFGKSNSLMVCITILVLTVINLIYDAPSMAEPDATSTLGIIRIVTSLVLASMLTLMTMAKYSNKEERGAK